MQAVPSDAMLENLQFSQIIEFSRHIPHWVAFCLSVMVAAGCGSPSSNGGSHKDEGYPAGVLAAAKMLRRGLTGEPQTLNPQIADDTYSFQVVRDLYEGLTAEDRRGRKVPGVAK